MTSSAISSATKRIMATSTVASAALHQMQTVVWAEAAACLLASAFIGRLLATVRFFLPPSMPTSSADSAGGWFAASSSLVSCFGTVLLALALGIGPVPCAVLVFTTPQVTRAERTARSLQLQGARRDDARIPIQYTCTPVGSYISRIDGRLHRLLLV